MEAHNRWQDTTFEAVGAIRAHFEGRCPELPAALLEAIIRADLVSPWRSNVEETGGTRMVSSIDGPFLARVHGSRRYEVVIEPGSMYPRQFAAFFRYLTDLAVTVGSRGLNGVEVVEPTMHLAATLRSFIPSVDEKPYVAQAAQVPDDREPHHLLMSCVALDRNGDPIRKKTQLRALLAQEPAGVTFAVTSGKLKRYARNEDRVRVTFTGVTFPAGVEALISPMSAIVRRLNTGSRSLHVR